jgi:hypothetical protein
MQLIAAALRLLPIEKPLLPEIRLDIASLDDETCTTLFR